MRRFLPAFLKRKAEPFAPPGETMRTERAVSPILLRILAVNVMALAILVGGILYLGNYQDRIIETELNEMSTQARIVANAVAENAVVIDKNDQSILSPLLARLMVRRLADTTTNRMRVFSMSEAMLADSRKLLADKNGKPRAEDATPPDAPKRGWGERVIAAVFDVIDVMHQHRSYPVYEEPTSQRASQYDVAARALRGEDASQVWARPNGGLLLSVAVPVEHSRRVLGSVMLSRSDASIDSAIYAVRINILQIFFSTLGITILLSLYLARAIARPVRQLAVAAEILRRGQADRAGVSGIANLLRDEAIPDMTDRHDEIGDLSGALRALTAALARRVGDIENFAADVAHELKNPLTSLRSAVETLERVQDEAARQKLFAIVRDDVDRMTRLITDIASASRLDAELGRAKLLPLDIGHSLVQMEDYYRANGGEGAPARVVVRVGGGDLRVMGVHGRLMQVFQNLIDNALSFSPPDKPVEIAVVRAGSLVRLTFADQGPGVPENKREAIFDRFYSERPKAEKFGTHSGLGLSISKQIIEAHQGRIWVENLRDAEGGVIGARFTILLPAMEA